jgi:hypothetical protein
MSRGFSWVEHELDAATAWAQRWVRGHGRRPERSSASGNAGVELVLDPRGMFPAPRNPFANSRVEHQLDAATAWAQKRIRQRGRRAIARPTGDVSSVAESIRENLRGSSTSSTRRRPARSGASGNAGVELLLDPRGLFPARAHPFAKICVGRAPARRGDGLGTAVDPGTRLTAWAQQRIRERGRRAIARPTGVVSSVAAFRREDFRGSSTRSTHGGSTWGLPFLVSRTGRRPERGGSGDRLTRAVRPSALPARPADRSRRRH